MNPKSSTSSPSTWVHYYVCFLALVHFLILIYIVDFSSKPHEPNFVSLTETTTAEEIVAVAEKTVPAAKPAPIPATIPDYRSFIPEEIKKVLDLPVTSTSEAELARAEITSFLGWYQNQPDLKKKGHAYATQYLQKNPDDFQAKRAMALANLASGKYGKVRSYLSGIDMGDILSSWIDCVRQIENDGSVQCLTTLEEIRQRDPDFYPAAYVLLDEYVRQNRLKQAAEIVEYWRAKSVSNLPFVHLAIQTMHRQQQYVGLVSYLTPLELKYPKDWMILFYLGKGNERLKKADAAKVRFQKILASPEHYFVEQIGRTYFELGKIALTEGDFKSSIELLYQASQRIPDDSSVQYYLAGAYFKNEDFEKAIAMYQQMHAKEPGDSKIRAYLGMSYYEARQYQRAEKFLLELHNEGGNNALVPFYLAKLEEQSGNIPKAKIYLNEALKIDPNYTQAKKMLQRISSAQAQ